jgi:hypothetical protein
MPAPQEIIDQMINSGTSPLALAGQDLRTSSGTTQGNIVYQQQAVSTLWDGLTNALGRQPSSDEFNKFVSSNLDLNTAKGLLNGTADLSVVNNMAKQYATNAGIAPNPQDTAVAASEKQYEDQVNANTGQQMSLLDQLTQQQQANTTQAINENAGQSEKRLLNQMGASGQITQPNAQVGLQNFENQNNKTLSDAIGQIQAGKTNAGLGIQQQGQQNIEQARQFGANTALAQQRLGLQGQSLSDVMQRFNTGQNNQNQQFQQGLGFQNAQNNLDYARQQNANQPSVLDYISGGLGILKGGTDVASGLKGLFK